MKEVGGPPGFSTESEQYESNMTRNVLKLLIEP